MTESSVLGSQSSVRGPECGALVARRMASRTAAVGQGPHLFSSLFESGSASNRLSTEPRVGLGADFYVAEEAGDGAPGRG